ncbi:hypothetical protein pipiens_019328 [Culex pipiens pipiens]|uniref:Uncharacterized protein n=1 Tax=Culex pipiens pipiens TaxID=38569 RepID=A0ABD1DVK4_CULPP
MSTHLEQDCLFRTRWGCPLYKDVGRTQVEKSAQRNARSADRCRHPSRSNAIRLARIVTFPEELNAADNPLDRWSSRYQPAD